MGKPTGANTQAVVLIYGSQFYQAYASSVSLSRIMHERGRSKKMKNKDIKKMFGDKDFMASHSQEGCKMWGRSLIFDVPESGLKHVEVYEKRIFDEKGKVICNCNGYWYSLHASALVWRGTQYSEYAKHCMILGDFVSGNSFKRFSN